MTGTPASPRNRLLEQFARDNRSAFATAAQYAEELIRHSQTGNEFVAYVDAIGRRMVRAFARMENDSDRCIRSSPTV